MLAGCGLSDEAAGDGVCPVVDDSLGISRELALGFPDSGGLFDGFGETVCGVLSAADFLDSGV